MDSELTAAIKRIVERDQRYAPEAYELVCAALAYTIKLFNKPSSGPDRHVTGQELLEGIRRYTLEHYGPLSRTVLNKWGVQRTEDFGEIVFNLVDAGVLGKAPEDRKEDFSSGYDFEEAFVSPFRAASRNVGNTNTEKSSR